MYTCVLPLPHQEEAMKMAGIDVHKKVLMVVVVDTSALQEKPARRRFVTLPSELQRFRIWLQEQGVEEAVMESTAQYWRSVWLELEPHMHFHLAQAFSNRAPRGRKHDFKDAERLVRRLIADELILSFVPNGEQRIWRSLTRMKVQLTRDRVRLQNQMECLLEEMRIKLSIVVSNLLGASGLRILHALAQGETDPKKLAELGDERLHCTEEQLVDALTGRVQPIAPGNASLTTAAAAVDRSANGSAQPHDRAGHEVASGRRDPTGGSTWPPSGFSATDHRRGRGAGQYILFGGRVGGLGGNLSWQRRKRGAEPKQSLRERQ
jgi:transposase